MIYDKEYRRRALEHWGEGHTRKETAEVFKVDPSTLQRWKSRLKETGNLETQKGIQRWKKIDPSRLVEVLDQRPDAYLREIAEELGCSYVAIFKALKRLKISRKKNHYLQGN
jgi:transposase